MQQAQLLPGHKRCIAVHKTLRKTPYASILRTAIAASAHSGSDSSRLGLHFVSQQINCLHCVAAEPQRPRCSHVISRRATLLQIGLTASFAGPSHAGDFILPLDAAENLPKG